MKPALKIFLNYLGFIILIAGAWLAWKYLPELPTLSGWFVTLVGLAIAVVWVDKLKWGSVKPWNCAGCLSGWFTLILAFLFHVEVWYLYVFIGAFAGIVYEKFCMRWL